LEPLPVPERLKIYMLLQQNGMNFATTGSTVSGSNYIGYGFYLTRQEAEHSRTLEHLKATPTDSFNKLHIFELDIPNPAYKKE
jgi:hypothetical protein